MRKDELYDVHDAGHCSCYGATERVEFNGKPLNELAKDFTEEYMDKEVKELFELAGYKPLKN